MSTCVCINTLPAISRCLARRNDFFPPFSPRTKLLFPPDLLFRPRDPVIFSSCYEMFVEMVVSICFKREITDINWSGREMEAFWIDGRCIVRNVLFLTSI